MNRDDLEAGAHYWAVLDGERCVLLWSDSLDRGNHKFEIAGPWEVGIPFNEVDRVVCKIEVPDELSSMEGYF